jgi:hypothetical protein
MVCSMSWSWFSEARGEPACVCGHVWVDRLESRTMLLTDVLGVVVEGATSPQALACDEVVVALGS